MLLQKCMIILVLSLRLKSRSRDLVGGHQKFLFHQMTSIHRLNAYLLSSFGEYMPSVLIAHIYPQTSLYGRNFHPFLGQKILYVRFCLSPIKNRQSYPADPRRQAIVGKLSLDLTKLPLIDNLAWLLLARRGVITSKPAHDVRTSYALLLVRETRPQVHFWLVDERSILQTCLELCQFTQTLLKLGFARWKVSLPPEWQENQIIISFQNIWHITRGTQPERKMLCLDSHCCRLSHPNLEALLLSRHNWNNHCLVHSIFRLHVITLSVCTQLRPSTFMPLITIWARSWVFAKVPPLPYHALDAGTNPHVPFTLDWLINCMVSLIVHWSSHLFWSFHHRKMFPTPPCERGIISTSIACLLKEKLPADQKIPHSRCLDLLPSDWGTLYQFSTLDSPHP
jgi:hypothetical protein